MKRIALISFTDQGRETAGKLKVHWSDQFEIESWNRQRCQTGDLTLREFTAHAFKSRDALIFVGAAGIAVRLIAPFLKDKTVDPAVLVVDELGQFVIPILSGHIGGANELAHETAEILGAVPVITTATDLHHAFAVDVFARENDLAIEDMTEAKKISSAILRGEKIGFFSDVPVEGTIPSELTPGVRQKQNIYITQKKDAVPENDFLTNECGLLRLVPRTLVLGMGCRRGVSAEAAVEAAGTVLDAAGISRLALRELASVEQKKDEEALLSLSGRWGIPFVTYSAEELCAAYGDFEESDFVKRVIGVGNVCERAAVLCAEQIAAAAELAPVPSSVETVPVPKSETPVRAHLLVNKTAVSGVTAAIAAIYPEFCRRIRWKRNYL